MNDQLIERQAKLQTLLDEMEELSQGRSNFALRHFVVGQHDLPGRQRQQVILELQSLMFEMADTADSMRLLEIDIDELQDQLGSAEGRSKTKVEIQIGQKSRQVQALRLLLVGRMKECDTLFELLSVIPKVSADQLEAEEAEYWKARLARQFYVSQRDVGGNLNAILQMATVPGRSRPVLPAEINEVAGVIGLPDISKLLEEK